MSAINKQVTSDIGRAEGISMPVLLILLLVIFGSLAAASLPLAIGGIGILGSFAALRLLTLVTDVSIYSINITTILGLGLAIDYGLFMVSRFREELHRQDTHGGRGGRHGGHRRPHRRGLRHHRGGRAGQPHALPGDVPALDGLRRGGHRPGRHAGRADRPARPARGARPPGERAAGPPPRPAPGPGRAERGLVPDRAQRDAAPGGLRRGHPARAARPGLPVPLDHLGRHRRAGAARGRPGPGGRRGAEP